MKTVIRTAETHPLTWRLRDDKQPVWLGEYRSKNGYEGARKALTGMAPMGYLLGWRMTLAMQWLSETGISIADIAERIGYGSASAFSVAFTRYTGISRGKYARQRAALNVSRPALT